MDMPTAVKSVLGQYATFSGRASRSEYWWWTLAVVLVMLAVGLVEGALLPPMIGFEPYREQTGQPISMVVSLALLLPCLAVSVRRLHDRDKSGWWYLLGLIPVIGPVVLLVWYVQAGTPGDNRFGPDPLQTAE
jgi:uncharacterized membrane protein YhaH (DUF805 family)